MNLKRLSGRFLPLALILSLLVLAPLALRAASPTWARNYGGSGTDRADWIAKTSDGGYVLLGHTVSFGNGVFNLWILKLNSGGEVSWEKVYPTDSPMLPTCIKQISDGGYIVCGLSQPVTGGPGQAWVARLDATGSIEWQTAYGDQTTPAALRNITDTVDGGFIGTGYIYAPTDAGYQYAVWLIKMDSAGGVSWQKSYFATERGFGRDIHQLGDGGYILSATAKFSADRDQDFWVLRLNSTGTVLWQNTYGGSASDADTILRPTSDGGFVIAGNCSYPTSGIHSVRIYKLYAGGGVQWEKNYSSRASLDFNALEPLPGGGYLAAGYRDADATGSGSGWIVKIEADGGLGWQRTYGSGSYAVFNSMVLNEDGGATAAGDTLAYGAGGDAWVVRTDSSGALDPSCNFVTDTVDSAQVVLYPVLAIQVLPTVPQPPAYATFVSPQTLTPHHALICQTPCTVTCAAVVPPTADAGMTVQLTALAQVVNCTGALTYDWDFGDGATSTDPNPFHIYQNAGEYLWKVTANVGSTGWSESGTIFVYAHPDPQGTTWARHYGTDTTTERNAGKLRATADGGYILGCTTYESGTTNRELWFLKTDRYGAITGQVLFPAAGDEDTADLRPTPDGGAIVAAYSDSFSRAGGGDGWLLKLDASGNCEWQKAYGSGTYDKIRSVIPTADGGYAATGTTTSPASGDYDVWVLKLDATGAIVWQKSYGGLDGDFGYSILQTADGGYVVAAETLSFGAGSKDVWVFKIDSEGEISWQWAFGGPLMETQPTVCELPSGGYFVAASTQSFGAGNTDGLLLKLDPYGLMTGATTAGGFGWDEFRAMEITPEGGAILAGYTDLQAQGMGMGWLVRVSPSGDSSMPPLWQRAVGITGYDDFYGVALGDDGGFTASGNTIEFGLDALAIHLDIFGFMDASCPFLWIPATTWQSAAGFLGTPTLVSSMPAAGVATDTLVQGIPYTAFDPILCGPPCGVTLAAVVPPDTSVGLSTQFTSQLESVLCSDADRFIWDFGDGSTSTEANPWHTYAVPGNFAWCLTAGAGTVTETASGTIGVFPASPVQGTTWAHHYGDLPTERSMGGVRTTADGGYILGCSTYPEGSTKAEAWVLNLTSSGQIARQKIFLAEEWDDPTDLQPTPDGGAIVAAYTESFGQGGGDAWILKLDASGAPTWQFAFGGPKYDKILSIIPTSDGGYAAAGLTTTAADNMELWVLKLDGAGLIGWQWTYGGPQMDFGTSIRETSDGGYVVAGVTRSWGAGEDDLWILKLNSSGGITWNRTYGGPKMDFGPIIRVNADGDYLMAAVTESSGKGAYDGLIICVDPASTFKWARTYGGFGYDYFYAMEALSDGGAILAGYYDNRTLGSGDGWVARIDSSGNLRWQRVFGGEYFDSFLGVSVGADQGFTLAGNTLSWGVGSDSLAVHLDPNGNFSPQCEPVRVPGVAQDGVSLTISTAPLTPMTPVVVAMSISPPSAPHTASDQVICGPVCEPACTATVPTTGVAMTPISFFAEAILSNCPGAATFYWIFGDGMTDTENPATHTYLDPGTYEWSLEVMADGIICLRTGTITITSSPACQLTCTATLPETGICFAPISFTGEAILSDCTGDPTFFWTFGDGGIAYEGTGTHTYMAPGNYDWVLEVMADGVMCVRTGTVAVEAGKPGDGNGDGVISIGEVQQSINMFLGIQVPGNGVDCTGDGIVSIGEVQKVINGFLGLPARC